MSKVQQNIEVERVQFKSLLLQNPNYFGNLPDSKFKPVKEIASNVDYEELTCVGFNPDLDLLEATIAIKRPFGYTGDLCYPGSYEYVRFFVDYGSGWVDEGVASVNVHDIPDKKDCAKQNEKPLTFVVALQIDPKKYRCSHPFLPKVHAVLSWDVLPPVTVGIPPVWGNSIECNIQIKPRKPIIRDAFDDTKLKIPAEYDVVSDMPIPIPDPPPLTLSDLAELYQGKLSAKNISSHGEQTKVESHRFGFNILKSMLVSNTFNEETITDSINEWKSLGINLQDALSVLQKTKANVDYEEIECVGLDYHKESLIATFRVKRPYGYLGDLCKPGSFERIAFWADWNNECKWTYLGTSSVNVHDLDDDIPTGGICYCAFLPVSLDSIRKTCENPKIARIRAVLSWSDMPSTVDPEDLTYWGNRLDTHVQIRPGIVLDPNDHSPLVDTVGKILVCDVDQETGLATHTKINSGKIGVEQSPFGGSIYITGILPHPVHYLPGSPGLLYKISVRRADSTSPPETLHNSFPVQFWRQTKGSPRLKIENIKQTPIDPEGWYEYLADFSHPDDDWRYPCGEHPNLLAVWEPKTRKDDGKWEIMIEAKDRVTAKTWKPHSPGSIAPCPDGKERDFSSIVVCLDNTPPKGKITIDLLSDSDFIAGNNSVPPHLPPTTPATACGDFTIGKYIIGRFSVTDDSESTEKDPHFLSYDVVVYPLKIDDVSTPQNFKHVPSATSWPSIPTSGISLPPPGYSTPLPPGIWQLNTKGFQKCGYVVFLRGRDRTNWNSSGGYSSLGDLDSVGFCLIKPT